MLKTIDALANVALLREATERALDSVKAAAIADAAQLEKVAPDVYEIALCIENDGGFYARNVSPLVSAIAEQADSPLVRAWAWVRWLGVGRLALLRYGHDVAGPGWSPPEGARELLAAYFATVKYAETVAALRAELAHAAELHLGPREGVA